MDAQEALGRKKPLRAMLTA